MEALIRKLQAAKTAYISMIYFDDIQNLTRRWVSRCPRWTFSATAFKTRACVHHENDLAHGTQYSGKGERTQQ
jgi:hypothetical protein